MFTGPAPSRRAEDRSGSYGAIADAAIENWLRGLDSNQDNQLQRLACYQLHYPGNAKHFTSVSRGADRKVQRSKTNWLEYIRPDRSLRGLIIALRRRMIVPSVCRV